MEHAKVNGRGVQRQTARSPRARLNDRMSSTPSEAAERLRLALDLFATGEALMRQNLKRRHPAAPEAAIDARLVAWLHERPGAEHGDAAGRRGAWPRHA
jgi:hypothetical protein